MTSRLLWRLWVVIVLCGCSGTTASDAPHVRVYAAVSLKPALASLTGAFHTRQQGVTVGVTTGATGTLAGQIINGAPADVFLAADAETPRQLVERGLATRGDQFPYARGRLLLWVPAEARVDGARLGLRALADSSIRRVAIPNPRHAPYGRAATEALAHYGLTEALAGRVVTGENAEQAAQFAASGAADAALLPRSLAAAAALAGGTAWPVPESAHAPIDHVGLTLLRARDRTAAAAFCAFVRSAAGQAILQRHGLDPAPSPP
jgi:molybdate transport system substrate-binding protein